MKDSKLYRGTNSIMHDQFRRKIFAKCFDQNKKCPTGVLLGIFGGGVPPASPNPDSISDQKMSFSIAG